MAESCYLCGKEIAENDVSSGDHVVPRQLISRTQPKVKGFDYGGVLPAHDRCNNEFGPETYCAKALQLIEILQDPKCVSRLQHSACGRVSILAIRRVSENY